MSSTLSSLPFVGSGLGYREEIGPALEAVAHRLDVIECQADSFMGPGMIEGIERPRSRFRAVLPHGVNLSIGSPGRVSRDYLLMLRRICTAADAPWYSDHLAVTMAPGCDIGHLSPLWFTAEVLEATVDRVREVQDFLGIPLVLENIAHYLTIPGSTMAEPEFLHRLHEATGCGFLLDVANLHINATNHEYDPFEWLRSMPRSAIVAAHIAGGVERDGLLQDSHSAPVHGVSWQLLEALVESGAPIRAVTLEHDMDFPRIEALLAQVERAREILAGARTVTEITPSPQSLPVTIERATSGDIDRVFELWRRLNDHIAGVSPALSVTCTERAREIRARYEAALTDPELCLLVARSSGEVIGYVLGQLQPPLQPMRHVRTGNIIHMMVEPDRRSRGAGANLLASLEDWFRQHGAKEAQGVVAPENTRAREFWFRQGFRTRFEQLAKPL